jgi:thiamine biosynthesis lipoprotein
MRSPGIIHNLFRHWGAVAALAFVLAIVSAAHSPAPAQERPRPIVFHTQTMGTWASLTVVTADSAAVAKTAYEALVVLHHVDSLMSNWTTTSEVARINREAARGDITIHPEVADVLEFALDVGRKSGGAFDITIEPLVRTWGFLGGTPRVPSQKEIDAAFEFVGQDKVRFDAEANTLRFARDGVKIDLGGIAKGYGVDRVAKVLRSSGVTDALVDLSGNMVALGDAAGRHGWAVGVRDPSGHHPWLASVVLEDEAVATSGDYEQFVGAGGKRYGHILDPRTGSSARGLASVTVVAAQAMTADAWSTALFVLGPAEARRVAHERADLAVILIEPGGDGEAIVWVEEQLRSRFKPATELETTLDVRFF